MKEKVILREVGLRDGLQMVAQVLSTERKLTWIQTEAEAGVREIEVTSFVPPAVIPQFADAVAVSQGSEGIAGLTRAALVPNLKGAQRGFDMGLEKINFVVSASETHNQANVRRTSAESVEEFRRIVAERDARGLRGKVALGCGVATSFGCTLQGDVPETAVLGIFEALLDAGADEVGLADTVGYANPAQVARLFKAALKIAQDRPVTAHFHDTRGLGIANLLTALEVGIRRFDASLAGLGGCPFAPGATGNVTYEDCAFLLETEGFETGVDFDKLFALRRMVETWLDGETFMGGVYRAGLPKTFGNISAA
ncbi:MAG: hydroxymethylglutaryl-CoA lyase [Thalassovita sp.]